MYLEKFLGSGHFLQTKPTKLTDHELAKMRDKILQRAINAIQTLNLTSEQLGESHNKQKALTVAWEEIYAAVCALSERPTWEQLPNPVDAYEQALKLQN